MSVSTTAAADDLERNRSVTGSYVEHTRSPASAVSWGAIAADKARKASAKSALWLFVSLLIGAFIASLTAILGGRRRDA